MLYNFEVCNYRSLRNIEIPSLGRVNLITGRNNSGKSTLLEALSILASKGDIPWMLDLLNERGENYIENKHNSIHENLVKSLSCLFNERKLGYSKVNSIILNANSNSSMGYDYLSMRFVKYIDELVNNESKDKLNASRIIKRTIIEPEKYIISENIIDETKVGFEIANDLNPSNTTLISLDENISIDKFKSFNKNKINNNIQFIRTRNIDKGTNGRLWDGIALTEKERIVVDALKIIEPNIKGITFISSDDGNSSRIPVVRINEQVVPLKSMGDGINRIFTIVLAIVNCKGGYMFIDEFENGLHHSVQEQLWSIIFDVAEDLDVQVFASTHSDDCIKSLSKAKFKGTSYYSQKLIRLDNKIGDVIPVSFDAEELDIITKQSINAR